MKALENKTAIVSGGLGDIGRAIARELASRGANVAIAGRRAPAAAEEELAILRGYGVGARYDSVDVADGEAVQNWIAAVERELGTPSLVVPCAATVTRRGVREVTSAEWTTELRINLDGSFHVAQSAAVRMIERSIPGHIVFVGSWVAERPMPRIAAYCVSKAGVRMLMKCMAVEFAPHGILVNEVAAGYVDAGLTGQTFQADPARRQRLVDETPVHKIVTAEEVAWLVAQLCDPHNENVTGTAVLVDGGLSLRT
jgi:NAD(P)-dependent dehydrogenase (short-subunit alcohol dehydrogenase family)